MYRTIVVPIDVAQMNKADVMIKTAKRLADEDAKIVLTNIIEDFPAYVVAELPDQHISKAKDEAISTLKQLARSSGLDTELDVRVGHPATAILAVADNHDADAIVIASHQPGLQDYLLGSTAARVVRHATCTVAVIR